MANGIEELFPELQQEQQAQSQVQTPEPEPTPPALPPGPSPEVLALQGQVQQLTNLVGQLATQPRPQAQSQAQVDVSKIFEDTTFFTPEDTRLLLQTQQPEHFFNKMGNDIKRSVAQPLVNIIAAQTQQLTAAQMQQQELIRRQQLEQAARENVNTFYATYPELRQYEKMVAMEAGAIEQEMAVNPQLRVLSPTQAHKYLAERVQSTLRSYGLQASTESPVQAEPAQQQQRLSPNTRKPGFMERGSGTRPTTTAQPKDPNSRELAGMSQHLSRQRSR